MRSRIRLEQPSDQDAMLSDLNRSHWLNLGIIFPLVILNGWIVFTICQYLQPIPKIVITASLVAFLLEIPVVLLEKRGLARGWAILLVILFALMLIGISSLTLGPIIFQQLVDFANRLPVWLERGSHQLQLLEDQSIFQNLPVDLNSLTDQLTNQITTTLRSLTSQLIGLTIETISSTVDLLLTLVLSILLVIYGPALWRGLLTWLPLIWRQRIQEALQPSFQGYFAGQAIIALILGIALSMTFQVMQVPFGLLFGLGIGIASIIPFGGSISISVVSGLLAFQNVWLGLKVLVIALLLAQINEQVIAPRLLSGLTGLNPAVVVVSLLVGTKVGGFLGLILAVPTASFIKRIAELLRPPADNAMTAVVHEA